MMCLMYEWIFILIPQHHIPIKYFHNCEKKKIALKITYQKKIFLDLKIDSSNSPTL